MIKPEFWSDEKLALLSLQARLTYIGLWNLSDDYGVVKGHPAWLKNSIYPYDDIRLDEFGAWLSELIKIGRIVPFLADGEKFYAIIDGVFDQLRAAGCRNLILDPRGNSGGDPFCAAHLLAYLAPAPVPYFARVYPSYATLAEPLPLPERLRRRSCTKSIRCLPSCALPTPTA